MKDWLIVYAPDTDEWQVSDGPVGERGISYDFKTKEEAEECLDRSRPIEHIDDLMKEFGDE